MDELSNLMDQFDKREEDNKKRAEEYARTSEDVAEQFELLRTTVIIPTLRQLHDRIAQRGHALTVRHYDPKEVVMEVIPRGSEELVRKTHLNQRPHLSFRHIEGTSSVQVYECKMMLGGGGQAGVSMKPNFSEVTPEVVTKVAMNILRVAL